jgi:CBS domain-containing protein
MKVHEIMTRDVLAIGPEADVWDVPRILVENHISGLPVCDDQCQVLGVVSEGDILFKEHDPELGRRRWIRPNRLSSKVRKARAIKVREAMTAPPIVIPSYVSVAEAARVMSEKGVNRLPVVDGQKLVGIVTRTDLVRAFVRPDEDIAREILEDVLPTELWIEAPEAFEVKVERGAVRLMGKLDTRSDAQLLERLSARVPGVVSVESEVTWMRDDTTRKAKREARSAQEPVGGRW